MTEALAKQGEEEVKQKKEESEQLQQERNSVNLQWKAAREQAQSKIREILSVQNKRVARGVEAGGFSDSEFKFIDSKGLKAASRKPIEWAVANLWTQQAKLLIAAQQKAGKTFFVVSIAEALASGRKLWGQFDVLDPGPIAIVGGEDDEREIARRLDRMCRADGLDLEDLPVFYMPASGMKLNHPRVQDFIRAECRKYGFRTMIFDPLARLMEGDENNKEVVAGVFNPLSAIGREENITVCVVHHLAKDNPDKPRPPWDRVRGSSDIASWFSCGLFLSGQLRAGRVLVEIQQRVSGKVPADFHVDAIEVDEESVYGLGTIRLVARLDSDDDAQGSNEKLIDAAKDKILDLVIRKRRFGLTLSEISIHLGYGKGLMNAALKKLIREDGLVRFEKAEDIPDGKVIMPILARTKATWVERTREPEYDPETGEVYDRPVFAAAVSMPAPPPETEYASEDERMESLFSDGDGGK